MLKSKKLISLIAILSLLGIYGLAPTTEAANLLSSSDTLSDSDLSVSTTHTVEFTTRVALAAADYIEVALPADFGVILGTITCPASTTAATSSPRTARCTAADVIATGTKSIVITGVTNPATAGSRVVTITTYLSGGTQLETADVRVAIIDNVDVSAKVASTLSFEIRPLATSTDVNGFSTTVQSATTSLAFGTLTVGTSTVLGQELRVTTNANDGYSVTVEQDHNLVNAGNADIDSFVDGTSTAPQSWATPSAALDAEWTYGHFGFTSDDANLAAGDTFGSNLWRGFNGTTPVEVMYHTGPSDGSTQDKGMAKVAYRIQVSTLQEPGDYTNALTYIATPTY